MSIFTAYAFPSCIVVEWLDWKKIRVLALLAVYTRNVRPKLSRVLKRERLIAMFLANSHSDIG